MRVRARAAALPLRARDGAGAALVEGTLDAAHAEGLAAHASRVAAATDAQGGALAAQQARLGATLAAHTEGQQEEAHTAPMAAATCCRATSTPRLAARP